MLPGAKTTIVNLQEGKTCPRCGGVVISTSPRGLNTCFNPDCNLQWYNRDGEVLKARWENTKRKIP